MFNDAAVNDIGARIQSLRKRYGLSIRELARKAEVSAAMISYAERGVSSLSLVTLQKVLTALGTSLTEFVSGEDKGGAGPVFARERMRVVAGEERTYTILLSKRPGVQLEMFDEHIQPSKKKPEYAKLECDVAGYVLAGCLVLDVKGAEKRTLRAGDAFYVGKGTAHRGYAVGDKAARLVTASYPASYKPS
jgi:transcriptional regulator with XRE-family HTH domain